MNKTEWQLNAERLATTLETRFLTRAELGTLTMLLSTGLEWLAADRVLARRALTTAAQLVDQAASPERAATLSDAFAAVNRNGMIRTSNT